MSDVWSEIAEVVGTSAIVSALVNFALDQWKSRKERIAARLEEHLKYSVENYPHFITILARVTDCLSTCNDLNYRVAKGMLKAVDLTQGIYNLLYFLGGLFALEDEFQSKQGQMFRLGNQSVEEVANSLYTHAKSDMYLSESQQQVYLAQIAHGKNLKEFRQIAAKDREVRKIIHESIKVMLESGTDGLARRDLETLGRLLFTEIESIRIPGYVRKVVSLSKQDEDFIEGLERIPMLSFSDSNLADCAKPLEIWVYNNWGHQITWAKDEVQFRVSKEQTDGTFVQLAELEITDPNEQTFSKRLEIQPGETLVAKWRERPNVSETGRWRITYLPDAKRPSDEQTYRVYYQG